MNIRRSKKTKPHREHKAAAPKTVSCAILTVSDSKTRATDETGRILEEALKKAGHRIVVRLAVPDDAAEIRGIVRRWLDRREIEAVITNGGTGLSSRDVTIEALRPLLEKELTGFGEVFRMLSYAQVGSAAVMSRATAGRAGGKLLVCLPGSPRAAELALRKILLPEIGHMVQQISR